MRTKLDIYVFIPYEKKFDNITNIYRNRVGINRINDKWLPLESLESW
jgi:hypothetical protein